MESESARRQWTPPDHWDDVDKLGGVIPMGSVADFPAKLVAARVPLDAKYTTPDGEQWTPLHLLEECQARDLAVNMVIDLTNTFKYYDGVAELQARGVEYVKMKVEGFADVPNEDIVQRFITVLTTWEDKFRQRELSAPSQGGMTPVIVVHCTHGLNRTGYLIARYLIATKGVTVKEALATFTTARPPGLIKHMYVQTLYDKFDQGGDVELPELPQWALNKYDRSKDELAAVNKMPFAPSAEPLDRKRHRANQSNLRRPPANWFDPPRMGAVVADSPFLPMRTLLDDSYDHGADLWTPDVFVAEQALRGHDVRLVVDLTNTTKYYHGPSAFDVHGIEYKKFALEGFSAAPSAASVAKFLDLVDVFEKEHLAGRHLALHCTHGLNRTGYLIASYLITRKQYSVQAALDAFAAARPPGLIKFLYIDALHKLHSDGETCIKYPDLPPWASKKYAKRATPQSAVPRLWPPPSHWAATSPHGSWITVPSGRGAPTPVIPSKDSDDDASAANTNSGERAVAGNEPARSGRAMHLLPMKAMLDDRFDTDGSWTVDSFVSLATSERGPVHGVVSFSDRDAYYADSSLPATLRRAYLRIRSGQVPNHADVDEFYRTLSSWQDEVGDDDELRVAVHCTVGSRTAFYVMQCLVDFAQKTVDEAKVIYEAAWPPGFVTKGLLKNLYYAERKKRERMEGTSAQHDSAPPRRSEERERSRGRRSRDRLNRRSAERYDAYRYSRNSHWSRDASPLRRSEERPRSRSRGRQRRGERRSSERHDNYRPASEQPTGWPSHDRLARRSEDRHHHATHWPDTYRRPEGSWSSGDRPDWRTRDRSMPRNPPQPLPRDSYDQQHYYYYPARAPQSAWPTDASQQWSDPRYHHHGPPV